ncbi:hypothetical protein D3C72_970600 [compost metagenome]
MVHHLVALDTDAAATLTGQQLLDGKGTHAAGHDAIASGRRAATLDVTQNGGAGFTACHGFDVLGQGVDVGDVLTDGDDGVLLAFGFAFLDLLQQLLFVKSHFRHYHVLGATGNGGRHGQIATVAAHDLDHRDAVVGAAGVAQTVDGVDHHVQGGVKADGEVGTGDVVVYGARQTDAGETLFGQLLGTHVGAVTTDHHQGIDAVFFKVLDRLGTHFRVFEGGETGGAQEGAAAVDHVGDAVALELDDPVLMQTEVAIIDAVDFQAMMQTGAHHGANGCVHTRCVTTTGQNTNTFDLFGHECLWI